MHKPNVVYITTSIAALFFVCFVSLVVWHMKETGRICFNRKDDSRRNTFNSQHNVAAAAARKRLREKARRTADAESDIIGARISTATCWPGKGT